MLMYSKASESIQFESPASECLEFFSNDTRDGYSGAQRIPFNALCSRDKISHLRHTYGLHERNITKKVYELLLRKQYQKAITILNDIRSCGERIHSNPKLWSLLGFCYYQAGNYGKASECYAFLFENCPEESVYGLFLAHCYALAHRLEDALHVLDSLLDDGNLTTDARALRSAILIQLGKLDEASVIFEEAGENKQNDFNYGVLLYNQAKFHQARVVFENVELTQGAAVDCQYAQALCFFQLEDYSAVSEQCSSLRSSLTEAFPELQANSVEKALDFSFLVELYIVIMTLLAGSSFELGRTHSTRTHLASIPIIGHSTKAEFYRRAAAAYLLNERASQSCDGFADLVQSKNFSDPSLYRSFFLLCLESNRKQEAEDLLENHGDQLHDSFDQEYEWPLLRIVLLGLENPLAAVSASMDLQRTVSKDIAYYQRELDKLQSGLAETGEDFEMQKASEKIERKFRLATKGLCAVKLYVASLYYQHKNYIQAFRMLDINPNVNSEECSVASAHCLFMAGEYEEAGKIYEDIINHCRNTRFTLISAPVDVVSHYCATQLFDAEDVVKIKETIAEILRSEKMNFEDAESEYRDIAFRRSHLVSACLNIAVTFVENGSYLDALRKAEEVIRLQPWHLDMNVDVWSTLKKVIIICGRNLMGQFDKGDQVVWRELISHLRDLEGEALREVSTDNGPLKSKSGLGTNLVDFAKEIRDVRFVCQIFHYTDLKITDRFYSARSFHKRTFSRALFEDLTKILPVFVPSESV